MKRLKIYICNHCGNIITSDGEANISCCGGKLEPQTPMPSTDPHLPKIEVVEDEHFITFPHQMSKDHYLSCVIYVGISGFTFVKLYAEQTPEFRLPMMHGGKLLFYCSLHGLFEYKL